MCDVQQFGFFKIIADQLQAHRPLRVLFALTKTARDRHAGQARQAGRERKNIGQVIGHRIIRLVAQIPGHGRCHWPHDDVALFERGLEILRDQAANFLRLQVIGIVITVRQNVRPHQNAALDLFAKTFGAGLLVHVAEVFVFGGAVAVAHPVKTAQVRRGFGRRDHVIHRNRQFGLRQGNIDQRRAEFFVFGQGGTHGQFHIRSQARTKKFTRYADAQAFQVLGQIAVKVFFGAFYAGRIFGIKTDHGIEQQAAIFGVLRDGAALVKRRSKRNHAVTRDAAVSRLDSGHATKSRRLADRSAGVGGGGGRCQACRNRRRRTAGRAAGNRAQIPWVFDRAKVRILIARTHSEFIAIEFTQSDGARCVEMLDHGGIKRADVIFQHARAGSRAPVTCHKNIFMGNRDAGQQRRVTAGQPLVGRSRLLHRQRRINMGEGIQWARFNARQVMPRQFGGGYLFALQ